MDSRKLVFFALLWSGMTGALYALNDPTQPTDPALYLGTAHDRKSTGYQNVASRSSMARGSGKEIVSGPHASCVLMNLTCC
jgi:hypothetical protein